MQTYYIHKSFPYFEVWELKEIQRRWLYWDKIEVFFQLTMLYLVAKTFLYLYPLFDYYSDIFKTASYVHQVSMEILLKYAVAVATSSDFLNRFLDKRALFKRCSYLSHFWCFLISPVKECWRWFSRDHWWCFAF